MSQVLGFGAEEFGGRALRFGVLSDAVARHAQLLGYGPKGKALLLGLLHRFPSGLLGRRGSPSQRAPKRFLPSATALGGYALDLSPLLIG